MVEEINRIIVILFLLCYAYQLAYIPIALFWRGRKPAGTAKKRYAVLIAARNEERVLGQLLDSLSAQSYPQELMEVFVIADNCTDSTAELARERGATVFERSDTVHVGKGYALNYLLERIYDREFDGYLVLDADNVLEEDYLTELNRVFSDGYEIVTSRRNSKNYGDNWISAGYALWFLRESRYLNGARMKLGTSCAVSGTGFVFSRKVLEDCGGWNFFLLTEDIEFTVHNITRGVRIGYAERAMLYDEQPTSFAQSWRQRLRWSRGYLQVFSRYGGQLLTGAARGSFSCYDMAMNIMPAAVLTAVSVAVNFAAAAVGANILHSVLGLCWSLYATMFFIGAVTTVTEWRSIHCSPFKKVLYIFTFPIFMSTYIPICLTSIVVKPEWKPIEHKRSLCVKEIYRQP